jgi:hypothetical protein
MKIQNKKVSELNFDPRNARKHPDANLEALMSSLTQFGQRKPIVITKDGTVVAGNGTLDAAMRLGWTEIDTVEIPADWDSKKVAAFALADNRTAELAQWDARELLDQLEELSDFDMNSLGFDAWNAKITHHDSVEETPESRGLGTPIISFEIVFDNHDQQNVWFEFLKVARLLYPDAETNAERIIASLEQFMESNG